jgi:hypothetical protein
MALIIFIVFNIIVIIIIIIIIFSKSRSVYAMCKSHVTVLCTSQICFYLYIHESKCITPPTSPCSKLDSTLRPQIRMTPKSRRFNGHELHCSIWLQFCFHHSQTHNACPCTSGDLILQAALWPCGRLSLNRNEF